MKIRGSGIWYGRTYLGYADIDTQELAAYWASQRRKKTMRFLIGFVIAASAASWFMLQAFELAVKMAQ